MTIESVMLLMSNHGEERSRTFLDGDQQLAGVGYEEVRGESREKTYLTEMLKELVSP